MAKTYTLNTLEDVFRLATNENIELLISDLAHLINLHVKIKNEISKKRYKELIIAPVRWTNDGETGIKSVKLNGIELKKNPTLTKIRSDEDFVNDQIKKAIESLTPERLRTYLSYLLYSFGEHVNIDEAFYHKHVNEDAPFPDELIKEYKENLIEILTHDDK